MQLQIFQIHQINKLVRKKLMYYIFNIYFLYIFVLVDILFFITFSSDLNIFLSVDLSNSLFYYIIF